MSGGVRKVSGRSGFLVNSIIVVSPKVYARVSQAEGGWCTKACRSKRSQAAGEPSSSDRIGEQKRHRQGRGKDKLVL